MKSKKFWLLFLTAVSISAQSHELESRKSYQELLNAHDHGLMDSLKKDRAYVCFREKSDEFLLVYFQEPVSGGWSISDDKQSSVQPSYLGMDHYQNGASATGGLSVFLMGTWTKSSYDFVSFTGMDKSGDTKSSATVDDDEITISEEYKNRSKQDVAYSLTIRRSTGRFSEEYRIDTNSDPNAGKCLLYAKGKLLN